jgi:glycosyltransferase
MNKGLAAARGKIICFLNADDFYVNSTVLEKVETAFNLNPKLNYCYGDICYVGAMDHKKIIRYWKSKENAAANLKEGWIPPHPAFFIKNELLQKVGNFNANYKFAADFDFILRCLLSKDGEGIYIPLAMVNMKVGGLTNKNFRNVVLQNIEILRILRAHNLKFSRLMFMFKKFIIRLKQRWDVL